MEGGNAAIAMYYAGDYLTMLENNEDLAFVVPEEGSNWFVDAICVLKSSQHKAEAYVHGWRNRRHGERRRSQLYRRYGPRQLPCLGQEGCGSDRGEARQVRFFPRAGDCTGIFLPFFRYLM